jgi:energy-coupling factor transporter ATP-binding protein EcfA2
MTTIDSVKICPYTGLRSFTEEESLYFKGRDLQVDQITALLEQNKFLMVTGASGEGKSSLIFAGLIPNARAGFFKAKYTNWVVADFRPERSPVKNMAHAIAEKFDAQPYTVETELRRGFSSLADFYTSSAFYIDEADPQWELLSETEKRNKKRNAANLMILVDQFEEFFTNPENFFNEVPSQDSQIVVNLILETARIAIKRNLPIYVVCTMRSDYIGQCSAFRGLPEYIGFSQFFVPRLKRKDLKQVIEEPAILSGNRISQRLIERLVFDIAEGVDQLPILQHALSQVWRAAGNGKEEMDLIHYAMVGGMPASELPDDEQERFDTWFSALPDSQRKYHQTTGLNKVIEIHASTLYENAWEYYNRNHPDKPLSQHDAKRIIVNAFCCLTKIDNSRAVRNRMTLGEITEIINTPEFNADVVGDVINIFRQEGNSFIRPFITDDPASQTVTTETVLDITHESLIRNWNKLNKWANQEFEFYSTYLDFKKQLDRWNQSGKRSGFLLPIGPLTYFENWYKKCKPNPGWIRRYSEIDEDQARAAGQARLILNDIQEFLKRSARKVFVTRAFMKYGPQRIATTAAIIVLLTLSGFFWYDAEQKKNENVLRILKQQAEPLLQSPEVNFDAKANYILILERSSPGSLMSYLQSVEPKSKLSLSIFIYKRLLEFNKHYRGSLKDELIQFIVKNFEEYNVSNEESFLLTERNRFMVFLAYDEYYNPEEKIRNILTRQAGMNKDLVLQFFNNTNLFAPTVTSEINLALQYWLTFGNATQADLGNFTTILDPQPPAVSAAFTTYYRAGSFEPNGREPSNFNGGYHMLASLYAAQGKVDDVIRCFEKIIASGQRNYFELPRVFNNHINILGYLYLYGHREAAPQLVNWISTNTTDNPPHTLYRNAVIRSGVLSSFYVVNIYKQTRSYRGYFNINLSLAPREVVDALFEDYENVLNQLKDPNESHFMIAINYKRRAMFLSKNHFDRNLPQPTDETNLLFARAIEHYRKVDENYLLGTQPITIPYFGDGVRIRSVTRKQLFLYPDYMDGWFARPYNTDAFFNYLNKNNLLSELYQTPEDFASIHFWIAKAHEEFPLDGKTYTNFYPLPEGVLERIISLVDQSPGAKDFDKNLAYLILANKKFQKGDTANGFKYFRLFDQSSILRSSERYEYIEKTFFLNQMKYLATHLALNEKYNEATQLAEGFDKDYQRIYAYIFMSDQLYHTHYNPQAFVYLDSALSLYKRIDFNVAFLDSRVDLLLLMSKIGSEALNGMAMDFLRTMDQNARQSAIQNMVDGVASEGNYYRALTMIPPTFTENSDLFSRMLILHTDNQKKAKLSGDQTWKTMDDLINWFYDYTYFMPN